VDEKKTPKCFCVSAYATQLPVSAVLHAELLIASRIYFAFVLVNQLVILTFRLPLVIFSNLLCLFAANAVWNAGD
jgi:hypothetical protein